MSVATVNHFRFLLLGSIKCLKWGFPCGSAGKESACNVGDLGSIPGLGRSPGEGKGYPFQYSGLENSKDCIVQGVAKGQTQLSDFHFTNNPESGGSVGFVDSSVTQPVAHQ